MTHDSEKSDSVIVAMKSVNNAVHAAAELMEPRTEAKGKALGSLTCRTQSRENVSHGTQRLQQIAQENRKTRFTALLHHVTVEALASAYYALKRNAATGVDGVTWQAYGSDLQEKLVDLHSRVHRGAYRAQPSRRRYIPKPDGKQRPLGIASLEDKIVQKALVEILNVIYEPEFSGFSYGFRPKRSQHDALDALCVGIDKTAVHWILDADIRSYFDSVNHEWLMRFLEYRIGDQRVIRLIQKWLKAGVMEDGLMSVSETGTPQGAVISPLLSNIYLHYVYDLWAQQWRERHCRGHMMIVRYADDSVCGFEYESDARRFLSDLQGRLATFALALHPDKTRLIEFGRFAIDNRRRRGVGKPETFMFLGFQYICSISHRGGFSLRRKTRSDRMRDKIKALKEQLSLRKHDSIPEQGLWLKKVVQGYYQYHAVPTNYRALRAFREHIIWTWKRCLERRGQRAQISWEKMRRLADAWLPRPRILHPWPEKRFAVSHPRWKPSA